MKFGRQGILFVISAPSGAVKTTVVQALRATGNFSYAVSGSTRPPRSDDVDAEHYRFLSAADFRTRSSAVDFSEHVKVHRELYGTFPEPVRTTLQNGSDVLIDSESQGAAPIW